MNMSRRNTNRNYSEPTKHEKVEASTLHKNIVKEIIRECYPAKLKPNVHFIAFLTRLLLLDPNWGITDDIMSSRANVQKFVRFVIRLLRQETYPSLITLQIQYHFTCNMANIDLMTKDHRRNLKKKLEKLEKSILSFGSGEDHGQLDMLKKLIVTYLTLITGLGNPKDRWVYAEAERAFTSIMNEDELKNFIGKSLEEQQQELDQMAQITCGIRLFNKDNDKGGVGIEDLPYLLSRAINAVRLVAQTTLTEVMETVNLLTTVLDKAFIVTNIHEEIIIESDKSLGLEDRIIEDIKDNLILYRQYEVYLRRVLDELDKLELNTEILNQEFEKLMNEIHKMVYMKLAVPAVLVFPKFIEVAKLWTQMQNQVVILSNFRNVMDNLKTFVNTSLVNKRMLESIMEEEEILATDADRLQRTAQNSITSENDDVQVLKRSNFQNLDKIKIQYLGFCCWKLVETKGALIPGNPFMGLARYLNRNYAFSDPVGCQMFSRNPEGYIKGVLKLCREKPQLIHFLQIEDKLKEVLDVSQLVEEKMFSSQVEDKGVQAVKSWDEVIAPNHDKGYRWNVWDLKREALMLASLTQKKTMSSQTKKAFSKNNMRNQTTSHKSVEMQTMMNAHTNVAKPQTFIYGLRGRRDSLQFVMDITRPLNK